MPLRVLTRVPLALLHSGAVHSVTIDDVDRSVHILVQSFQGVVRAWINRCPHWRLRLDSQSGRVELDQDELVCDSHGARFHPVTGLCTSGPCQGASLRPLVVVPVHAAVDICEPAALTASQTLSLRRNS